jgi:excinuclease Cho
VLSAAFDPTALAALPRTSGVYLFQGDGALPLYIGKSVDIKSRVLSHLRTPEEAGMLARTRRVDVIETAGEIGALLLESHLIKQLSPLFNVRLRRVRSLRSIQLHQTAAGLEPRLGDFKGSEVYFKDQTLTPSTNVFGLFASKHAAQKKLRELARTHGLCLGLLGLERTGPRGCFGVQIRTCRGACIGREARVEHDERLLNALTATQIHAWPYRGAIELVEEREGWVQRHRVENWRHLGTSCSRNEGARFGIQPPEFDLDSYKILVKPILLQLSRNGLPARR